MHIRRVCYACVFLGLMTPGLVTTLGTAHAQPASLRAATIGSAGGYLTSGAHTLGMTLGQGVVGMAAEHHPQVELKRFAENAGFWHWGALPVLGVEFQTNAPTSGIRLLRHTPNPFAARTTLRFAVQAPVKPTAEVLDVVGRTVQPLVCMSANAPGLFDVSWDGLTNSGKPAAAGVYFISITVPGANQLTRTVTLIR